MSGAQTPPAPPSGTPGADPSMEDILASIRRILSEDEPAGATGAAPDAPSAAAAPADDDVLALDSSMMVADDDDFSPPPLAKLPPAPEPPPVAATPAAPSPPPRDTDDLIAPATAAAVATSVSGLLRTLIAEREQVVVHRGGPTIEDMVREEIRPLLKEWLEVNLQPMVERLVRSEIERVVGRGVS